MAQRGKQVGKVSPQIESGVTKFMTYDSELRQMEQRMQVFFLLNWIDMHNKLDKIYKL